MNIRCPVMRAAGAPCPGRLVERYDRVTGRLAFACPLCERRKKGICADCDLPVAGKRGRSERCATHTITQRRLRGRRKYRRIMADPAWKARRNAQQRRSWLARVIARTGRGPMTPTEKARKSAAARLARTTPAQRKAIAMKANAIRWAAPRVPRKGSVPALVLLALPTSPSTAEAAPRVADRIKHAVHAEVVTALSRLHRRKLIARVRLAAPIGVKGVRFAYYRRAA